MKRIVTLFCTMLFCALTASASSIVAPQSIGGAPATFQDAGNGAITPVGNATIALPVLRTAPAVRAGMMALYAVDAGNGAVPTVSAVTSAGSTVKLAGNKALPPRGDELWGATCHNGSATTFGAGGTFTWDGTTPNSEGIISAPAVWDYGCYAGGTASAPDGGSNNVIWIQNSTNAIPTSNTCFTVRVIWRAAPKLVNTNSGLFALYTAQSGTIQVHANTTAGNLIWTVWNGSTSSDNVIPADASAYNGLLSGTNMLTVMYYTSGWTAWLNGERVVRATGLPSPLPTFTIGGTGWRWDFGTGAVLQQIQVWDKCVETTALEVADWATIQGF